MRLRDRIAAYFDALDRVTRHAECTAGNGETISLEDAFARLRDAAHAAHDRGGKLMFIGNGGSAGICSHMATDFSKRGASFNIPGRQVDGMDVEAVEAAGREAIEYCRAGNGPIILEMKTYRYRGHSMSDPAKYRSKEEVAEVREKRDPIDHFGAKLVQRGIANENDLKMIDNETKQVVIEAA